MAAEIDSKRKLIFSILSFLNDEMSSTELDSDSKESLEVACQCLENVYSVSSTNPEDRRHLFTPASLPSILQAHLEQSQKPVSPEDKEAAERLKNEGNNLMKEECYSDAIEKYTSALDLDPRNAVYYSNRAAAHSKMGNHELAIEDCHLALNIDPKYSKVMGRMGLAYTEMKEYDRAIESYTRALEFEPNNESYQNNLRVAQDLAAKASAAPPPPSGPTLGGVDLAGLMGGAGGGMGGLSSVLNNPDFMNMATKLMQNPQVMNAFSSAMQQNGSSQEASVPPGGEPPNMNAFLQMGQRLAEQIEREDPEQVARLREQFGGMRQNNNNPDSSGSGGGGSGSQ
ncbi:small glutamine-rich tetratricopeptide repeat-containing protein beta-like [Convolutriloba macropyga]|uniref:small glutamine-rich tetratricopeptide repeat-containing protein beta-like n=1 Tax=Convolutriloba macropyga TaxID=536237 RepID=UPI003F520426